MRNGKRVIVIKIGSSTLVDKQGKLNRGYFEGLAKQVYELRQAGWSPLIVSSAAIACGLEALGITQRPSDMPSLQAAASVGQNALMATYAEAFSEYDILTSCVLITRHSTANRNAYLHARDTLERLLDFDVVPIINENDTVSVEQIRFGDNDTLAALVSCLVKADLCVIFSDIDGLYTANPFEDKNAKLVPVVTEITPELMATAGGATSTVGSGGMVTKIRAARVLMIAGITMVICHGKEPDALPRIAAGQNLGTRFVAQGASHDITPRKLWIALGDSVKGVIEVDQGAKRALVERGSSLLPVGIVSVEGAFSRGDIVDIKDTDGHLFARGRAGAPYSEMSLARGRSQDELKGNELLEYLNTKPAVHRDELVVFE